MLEPGSSFGRYVIEALIGTGGMGQVYRAQDTRLSRKVALKLLLAPRSDPAQWGEATARMIREARAAAALEHPNAVAIYDVGEIDGTPYLAMELVRGGHLRDFVGDAGVTWETKLRWLVDVASALAAAHDAGLVHRDIKPRNVMVREDGRVKVLDFGIARRTSAPSGGEPVQGLDMATITTEGIVVGTPQYMPPEQLAGSPLDGRADQFAWGVMAYELFAGVRPWKGENDILATVTAILTVAPTPLGELVPELPPVVVEVIHRALAKMPDGRFPSMHEIVAALEPLAAPPAAQVSGKQRIASSSTPSLPHDSGRSQSGRSAVSGSSKEAVSASATAQTKSARGVAVDGPPAPAPVAPAPRPWLLAGAGAALLVLGGLGALALSGRGASSPAVAVVSAPSASSSAAPRPGAGPLELPLPASTVPAAVTAYREGLQAQHDASEVVARGAFLEALRADPGMGAAHLRYALTDFLPDVTDARTHFLKAQQLRTTLGEHEAALLDAFAPLFVENPSDWEAAGRNLEAAVRKSPADAELLYYSGWVREHQGKVAQAKEALSAALALDPRYAESLDARVRALQQEGDVAAVIQATDDCLRAAPSAIACLKSRIWTYAQLGRCEDYERDAHRTVAINPASAEGYEDLGQVALALGRPADAAWELLRVAWKHETPGHAAWMEADDRARTGVVLGDSKALDAALAQLARLNANQDDQWSHFEETELLVNVLAELGDVARAGQVADEFLRRRSAWTAEPGVNAWSIGADDVPLMLQALRRAGKITAAELDRRRDEWLSGWRKRAAPELERYLWIHAYAEIADTPEDAARALEKGRVPDPMPPHRPWRFMTAHIGHTYLLAGQPEVALGYLRPAAAQCEPFEEPVTWNRASLWLGEALEATGKSEEACAAYGTVASRWAGLGARSVSVREAKKRMVGLHCGR